MHFPQTLASVNYRFFKKEERQVFTQRSSPTHSAVITALASFLIMMSSISVEGGSFSFLYSKKKKVQDLYLDTGEFDEP